MDTAPEGSFKTIFGCWLAVCVASGSPVFGHPVHQGKVMIIDEETPEMSLTHHLKRFSEGLGCRYEDLPMYVYCMQGFRFSRKVELDKLLKLVEVVNPVLIRLDSMLAMLPGGERSQSENDCHLGEIIRDDLNKMLSPNRSILLAAHSKKYISDLTLKEISDLSMQSVVRGHGSIVGEGCDTGYIIEKISEYPKPTRFAIITRVRRRAIPSGSIKYIEMKEEHYGRGWARLELIPSENLPPSVQAREIYPLFKVPDRSGNFNHSSSWILREVALRTKNFCRVGVEELLDRKVIVRTGPQDYELNDKSRSQCSLEYLKMLENE